MGREYEIGPIRPPNEAASLLVRLTRNCPWNKCAFCPVYKDHRFERRSRKDVLGDLQAIRGRVDAIEERGGGRDGEAIRRALAHPGSDPLDRPIALWLYHGGRNVFLQDADAMAVPVADAEAILSALRGHFPELQRVTTYTRARTLASRPQDAWMRLRAAGLDRVHVGLESGSDEVLEMVRKGVRSQHQIEGGSKAKAAGLELSFYVMPGLGGQSLHQEHLEGTAMVLNAVQPHYIRLRSTVVVPGTPLAELQAEGAFKERTEVETVQEIRDLLMLLEGFPTTLTSDHDMNLLMAVDGAWPQERDRILATLDRFLALDPAEQDHFILGRRLGYYSVLADRHLQDRRARVDAAGNGISYLAPEDRAAAIAALRANRL